MSDMRVDAHQHFSKQLGSMRSFGRFIWNRCSGGSNSGRTRDRALIFGGVAAEFYGLSLHEAVP